jgi:hypothetical protein
MDQILKMTALGRALEELRYDWSDHLEQVGLGAAFWGSERYCLHEKIVHTICDDVRDQESHHHSRGVGRVWGSEKYFRIRVC